MNKQIKGVLDIEIYEEWGEHVWAQEKYLVHGYSDILWTSSLNHALSFLKESLIELEGGKIKDDNSK